MWLGALVVTVDYQSKNESVSQNIHLPSNISSQVAPRSPYSSYHYSSTEQILQSSQQFHYFALFSGATHTSYTYIVETPQSCINFRQINVVYAFELVGL